MRRLVFFATVCSSIEAPLPNLRTSKGPASISNMASRKLGLLQDLILIAAAVSDPPTVVVESHFTYIIYYRMYLFFTLSDTPYRDLSRKEIKNKLIAKLLLQRFSAD